jgi:hypothetical protein
VLWDYSKPRETGGGENGADWIPNLSSLVIKNRSVEVERGPLAAFREGLEGRVRRVTTAKELSGIPKRLRVMVGRGERERGERGEGREEVKMEMVLARLDR